MWSSGVSLVDSDSVVGEVRVIVFGKFDKCFGELSEFVGCLRNSLLAA